LVIVRAAADPFLTPQKLEHLGDVIGEAESRTSGEIRLVIVRRSLVAHHAAPMLWLIFIALAAVFLPLHQAWWILPTVMFGALVLAFPLSRWQRMQLWLTPAADIHHAVWARAEIEFLREGLSHTRDRTGILLFLSRLERQAVVLADQGIASKLPASTWDDVVQTILAGARSEDWAPKLAEAIRLCGDHLAQHFPAKPDDSDELSNAVVVKD
jgi:putative membrane protein